jgi:hypothetical protein
MVHTMAPEIITVADLQKFRLQLLEDIKVLVQPPNQVAKQWLRSTEVRKMLGISHGTLQNLRIRNVIPYQKVGGIIFYKYDDIVKLLENSPNSEK